MEKYRVAYTVGAIQYNKTNFDEIVEYCKQRDASAERLFDDTDTFYIFDSFGNECMIDNTDWVIFRIDNVVECLPDEIFQKDYKKIWD